MEQEFVTFQKHSDLQLLQETSELLKNNHIDCQIEDGSPTFDATFAYNALSKEYRLKIKPADFAQAHQLLEEAAQPQLDSADSDYYLFSFNDEELIEIVSKPDEWGKFDYLLAQKILKERGKEVSTGVAELLKKQRIKDLAEPDKDYKAWINAGYFFALLGGLMGLLIGLTLATHKKTLPTGERIYAYPENARKQGWIIFCISMVTFTLSLYWRISDQ